jgi:DNA-binding MarR family transcriptional regulator
MAFDKTQSAGFLANHMARLFATGLQRRVAPLGLAPAQFMVLLELWQDEGLTQRDLVERLDVEQATMANTLARMERDGLITRRPSEADRRARVIGITPKARDMRETAIAAAERQNRAALAALSEAERAELIRLMRKVIETMKR